MTDKGAEALGLLIFVGLLMNGCMSSVGNGINERQIVDERELGRAMAESACYLSGREWYIGNCREPRE